MNCTVYVNDTMIAKTVLMASDPSMGVSISLLWIQKPHEDFERLLIDSGAKMIDGVYGLGIDQGLKIVDRNMQIVPSAGASLMYAPEVDEVQLDVYGIERTYYHKYIQGLA